VRFLAVLVVLAIAPLAAMAQPAPEPEPEPEPDLRVHGRVFVRDTWTKIRFEQAPTLHDFGIASARAELDYRPDKRLRVSIELDFAGDVVEMKDVFVRVRPIKRLSVQAGRFKRPISPIALESPWSLPTVERGLLSSQIEYPASGYDIRLPFGGRSEGLQIAYEPKLPLDPTITVGVFDAELADPDGPGGDPVFDAREDFVQDVFGRATIAPAEGLEVGVAAATVSFLDEGLVPTGLEHATIGSVDVTYANPWLRVWIEGFGGRSVLQKQGDAIGRMWAARALIAPRLRVTGEPDVPEIEPFLLVSLLDPSDEVADDRAWQLAGGVSARFGEHVRLQLELERTMHDAVYPDPDNPRLGLTALYVQLGAAF
jgi:hypothetical protein